MKKNIISITLVLSSFFVPLNAFAIWPVFDAAQFSIQIPDFGKDIINTGASVLNQINTWETKYKLTILDPLANAMIAVTLLKQQSNTINLVTGSLGGNPLLISNPEQWVRNKGLDVVRISLGDISSQNGPYTDSMLTSVIGTFKNSNLGLQATLNNLNSSSIPTTVQNSLCADATLTQVAKNDIMKNDGTFDPAELATRKKEIYNSLCVGNPSSNPELAQRLSQVNSQRPDIAGWDTWLAMTVGGENEYNKSVRATLVISDSVEAKKKAKEAELTRGGGVASPSKCLVAGPTEPNGDAANINDAACRMESLTNVGSAVSASFQAAINAPLERLTNSFGSGILSSLATLLSARNTLGMLTNAFSGVSAGGGNTSITTGASSTPTADLVGNPEGRSAITSPITARITTYLASLEKLEEADDGLRTEINTAEEIAGDVQICYEKLMTDFSIDESYPGVSSAISYTRAKKQSTMKLSAAVDKDSSIIAAARAFISDMMARITASNSSEEISGIYSTFEDKVKDGTFPGDMAGSTREAEYQTLKGENQVDLIEGGKAFDLQKKCADIRQQLTPREQA